MQSCVTFARAFRNIALASTKGTAPNCISPNSMNLGLVQFIAALSSRWRSRFSLSKRSSDHLRRGARGEKLACRYLRRNGYKILYRNFRGRRGREIDIVCRHADTLVFVEVKTRAREDFGRPFEAVDRK